MKHIGIFSNSGDVQTALNEETLLNPYVALVSGSLDYNGIQPEPPVPPAETRVKVTYHVDEAGEFALLSDYALGDQDLVSVEIDGVITPLGDNLDPGGIEHVTYTATAAGDYIAYFTVSENSFGVGPELFIEGELPIPISSIEIPANITIIPEYSLSEINTINSLPWILVIPDVSMTFGANCLHGCSTLEVVRTPSMSGTGYIYIPAGSSLGVSCFQGAGTDNNSITAVTIGSGVTFEHADDDDDYGYQFEDITSLEYINFLGTVPPTMQTNSIWFEGATVQVPAGYESSYVSSFNTQFYNSDDDYYVWYFGLGLADDDHENCETGPTPGYICGYLEPDAYARCYLDWGCYDEGTDTCYPCGECPQGE